MSNYVDLFDSYSTGSGVPTGWTSRWDGGTWSIIDESGDKALRQSDSSANRYLATINSVDSDANRAAVDVLAIVRTGTNYALNAHCGIGARCSGTNTTETGYVLYIYGDEIVVRKYASGSASTVTETTTLSLSANTKYRLRLRIQDSGGNPVIQAKVWADGDSEPGTWTLESTDSSGTKITAAGWVGCFGFAYVPGETNTHDFFAIAVGTNGDVASFDTTLTPSLFTNTNTFYAPTVSGGAGGDQTLTPSLFTNTSTFYAPVVQRIQIDDDYERSSVNLSGSSVTGIGDSAVVVIKPRVQESEYLSGSTAWYEPSARITGVEGFRPTFRFSDYATSWSAGKYLNPPWGTRKPMFSYDRVTWNFFDTVTVNSTYIEFRHNSAFTSDTVYISKNRQISVSQVGDWIDSLEASYSSLVEPTISAAAFTPTLTSWPAQAFICDEFSSQTDELGSTIPATPFYGFQINDTSLMPVGGVKREAVLICGVHAGEDMAFWPFRALVESILGASADAQYLRKHFKIFVYPVLNAPGRAGGGWRGSFTQGTGGADDANKHFTSADGDGLEIVTIPKAAMLADIDGGVPEWLFDFHNTSDSSFLYGSFQETGDTAHTNFDTILEAATGLTHADAGDTTLVNVASYFKSTIGTHLSLVMEFGDSSTVTDATYTTYGANFAAAVVDYFQTLEPSVFTNTQTFYAPTVAPGVVDLTPSLFTNTHTFYSATVFSGLVLAPSLFTNTNTFYAATVTPGQIDLTPSLFTNTQTFYSPTVVSGDALYPSLFTNSNTFFAPTVTPGSVSLLPSLFANDVIFYSPTVANQGSTSLTQSDIDAIWDNELETGYTARQMMRIMFAALAGKRSGLGTSTESYYDVATGTTVRISLTPDQNGNGTPVVDGT